MTEEQIQEAVSRIVGVIIETKGLGGAWDQEPKIIKTNFKENVAAVLRTYLVSPSGE